MTSGWIIVAEVTLVLGLAVAWGFHELRTLRRLREERERRTPEAGGDESGRGS